jgi:FKBP-type peptidyl-prolyl cis-trans isomerase
MAHDVFISHSSKDKTIADAVCALLEQHKIRCWIAPRDITPGKEWGEAIVDAIHASHVMILIFSASANGSPQIRREVERAVNKEVVVVPFRIEDVMPTKSLEYFIGSVHWLDAFTKPLEAHVERLVHVVESILGSGGWIAPMQTVDTIESPVLLELIPGPPHLPPVETSLPPERPARPIPASPLPDPTLVTAELQLQSPVAEPPTPQAEPKLETPEAAARPVSPQPKLESSTPPPSPPPVVAQHTPTLSRTAPPAAPKVSSIAPTQARTATLPWRFIVLGGIGLFVIAVAVLFFSRWHAATPRVVPASVRTTAPDAANSSLPNATSGTSTTGASKEGATLPSAAPAPKNPEATPAKNSTVLLLQTEKDKFSYALGMTSGLYKRNYMYERSDPDIEARGLKDAMEGKPLLTEEEAWAVGNSGSHPGVQDKTYSRRPLVSDKASYAIGVVEGSGFQKGYMDPNIWGQGLKDVVTGNKTLLTKEEAASLVRSRAIADWCAMAAKGDAFLSANKTKPGVVTLPSGLQYKILTQGTGPKPAASDTVSLNFLETGVNGQVTESTFNGLHDTGGGPGFEYPVGQVINGIKEALQLMPVGSKWQLFIPNKLAESTRVFAVSDPTFKAPYGQLNDGCRVNPNAYKPAQAHIFEIELVSIQAKSR